MIKPTNNRFSEDFEKMKKDIAQLSKIPQPQLIEWSNYAPADFTANATPKYLSTTSSDIFAQIRKGFVVRLKQTGDTNFRYFWVVSKDSVNNRVYLAGGDSNSLASADIIEIAFSSDSNATGFPRFLDTVYDMSGSTSNIQVDRAGTSIVSISQFDLRFRMDSEVLRVEYEVNFTMNNFDFQFGLKLPDDLLAPSLIGNYNATPLTDFMQTTLIPVGVCTNGLFDPVTAGADDNATYCFLTTDGLVGAYASGLYIGVRTTPFDVGFGTSSANEVVVAQGYIDYEIIDT